MGPEHPSPDTAGGLALPVTTHNVDLSNCDRELIQYPGAIQPHGALLVLHAPDRRILQASANAAALLGITSTALLNQDFTAVFGAELTPALQARLTRQPPLWCRHRGIRGEKTPTASRRPRENPFLPGGDGRNMACWLRTVVLPDGPSTENTAR